MIKVRDKNKGNKFGVMERSIMEIGNKIYQMDKDILLIPTVLHSKVIGFEE